MSPPTRSNISHGFDGAFPKALINNELVQNRNLIGGLMSPPYGLSRFQRDKLKFALRERFGRCPEVSRIPPDSQSRVDCGSIPRDKPQGRAA